MNDDTTAIKNNQNLTPEQERVLRDKGTEAPGVGRLLHEKGEGMFQCAGCGQQLFASDTKFESGTGWPSFDNAIEGTVTEIEDGSHGMIRTEVVCSQCGGHLGHVFPDGPRDTTGKRYCINSCSLDFTDKDGVTKSGANDAPDNEAWVETVLAGAASSWQGKTYTVRGSWSIQKNSNNDYFLVFGDDFTTLPGPDLKLYATEKSVASIGDREMIADDGLFISDLANATGAQQYQLPAGFNPSQYHSIAIYCERYSVVWAGVDVS